MIRAAGIGFRCASRSFGGDPLTWEKDGRNWPNRPASRFIRAGGLTWHVQQMGQGPVVFLVHGTGASTHSWRDLAPLLAAQFTVVAPDLPGHGFTEMPGPGGLSLPGMATALGALLNALDMQPAIVAGHSAGAAILARMCLENRIAPKALISLNGAFLPLRGVPAHIFSPIAKLLTSFSLMPWLFARMAAKPGVVERLIADTGSKLDAGGLGLYRQLVANPGHVGATLGMMANWDLEPIERQIGDLKPALVLVVGDNDRTISPREAKRIQLLAPKAEIISLPGLGHLAHEERPSDIAEIVERYAAEEPRKGRPG